MTIEEGNKIIAEFMGFEYNRSIPGHDGTLIITLTLEDCRYHSSWDWLMPVVEKINAIHDVTNIYNQLVKVMEALWLINIKQLWLAVVEFMKWYNQQNIPAHI